MYSHFSLILKTSILFFVLIILPCCQRPADNSKDEMPEYFYLRPELEKEYGYTHAVKIGNDIKISGAVSMDYKGNLIGAGDMDIQMKNCTMIWEKF